MPYECAPQPRVKTPPIDTEIRRLIGESPLSIREIAARAQVPYQPLKRFMRGVTASYNAVSAELVFHELTGRSFTSGRKPVLRKEVA